MSRNDSDTDDILALYLYNKRHRRRRLRRISVHEIFQRRNTLGEYHHLVQELSFHPDKFSQYFRMTEEQFDYVLDLIKDDISKQDTNWKKAISPRERLAIGLRFRVGVATVSVIVREVCEAIWNRLQPLHLPAPTKEQWQAIEAGFRENWQFPNCLGALDGKQVMIQAPASSGSTYFNYKKTFSIVLLALIDHGYRFAVIDIGSYGSNSDAGVFRKSKLFKKMQNGTLDIPEDKILTVNSDQPCPHVIVGDEAFPLMKNLMRPYPGKDLDYAKRIYNYRLSRARRISENGFGILANCWRIYHRKIPLSPDNVDWVVTATVVLHNMLCCVTEVNGTPRLDVDENEDIHDGILRPMRRAGHRPPDGVITVREIFKTYFVSPAGAVTWQNEMCFGHPN